MKKIISLTLGIILIAAACNKQPMASGVVQDSNGIQSAPGACCNPPSTIHSVPAPQNSPKTTQPGPGKVSVTGGLDVTSPEEQQAQIDQNTIKNIEQDQELQDHENRISNLEQNPLSNQAPVAEPSPVQPTPVVAITTVSFSSGGPADSSVAIPTENFIMWQGTMTIANGNALMESFSLRQIGSLSGNNFSSLSLYVNKELVGSMNNLDSDGYVNFTLPNLVLNQGSVSLELTGSITATAVANRSIVWLLHTKSDIRLKDAQNDQIITPEGPSTITSGTQTTIQN